jgi:methanethiol S-methyltransferase
MSIGIIEQDVRSRSLSQNANRTIGIVFGLSTQLLFLWTVVQLFLFLRYGSSQCYRGGLPIDTLLSLGFAFPHSVLLAPPVQQRMKRWIPSGLLGCIHCCTTCFTLLAMFSLWSHSSIVVWQATGWTEFAILACFYASWVALLYSLFLTGMGYQTGLTQWWYWLNQKRPPAREFVERSVYRWMRHPIYMSFLGLIWFTPTMTLDHAVLTLIWTVYIYAGSYFKDRRMIRFLGDTYRDYASRVVGLPLIGFGPLGRLRRKEQA